MAVPSAVVMHVAGLARLAPGEGDSQRYGEQLGEVLRHAAALQPAAPSEAEVLNVRVQAAPLRSDRAGACLELGQVMELAPETAGDLVTVPTVIGRGPKEGE